MARDNPTQKKLIAFCKVQLDLPRVQLVSLCVKQGFNRYTSARIIDALRRARAEDVSIEEYLKRSRDQKREWYQANRIDLQKKALEYCSQNRELQCERSKLYLATEFGKANRKSWKKHKYATNPIYKTECVIRSFMKRVRLATKTLKTDRNFKEVGYTACQYYEHVIKTLPTGITYWDCEHDHIIPVAFLLSVGITDLKIINSLDNMQLLTPAQNSAKRDFVDLSLAKGIVRNALKAKGIINEQI